MEMYLKDGDGPEDRNQDKQAGSADIALDTLTRLDQGTKLVIDFENGPQQVPCTMMGYSDNNHQIIRLPLVAGMEHASQDGNPVQVRFMIRGAVYVYHSRVTGREDSSPLQFLFLANPANIHKQNLRRHTRVTCYISAMARIGQGNVEGVLLDLSPGGASFACFADEDKPYPTVEINDAVVVDGQAAGKDMFQALECRVRSISQDNRRMLLGLAFADEMNETVEMIGEYVAKVALLIQETEEL